MAHPAAMSLHDAKQTWLTVQDAAKYCGLSVRTIQTLAKDQLVVSSAVIRPGKARGRRLIERHSLDAWIQKGVTTGDSDRFKKGADADQGNDSSQKPSGVEGGEA